jgi:hypothetical protein
VASEGNVVNGWEREVFKDCQPKFGCQVNLECHIGGLKGLFINWSMISKCFKLVRFNQDFNVLQQQAMTYFQVRIVTKGKVEQPVSDWRSSSHKL